MKHNRVFLFSVWTYLCFWTGILLIGISTLAGIPDQVSEILQTIIAWVPTFVFLGLFHKLLPEEKNRWSYIKKLFSGRHIGKVTIILVLVQSAIYFLTIFIITLITHRTWSSLFQINLLLLISGIFTVLINGATGEELGWRGFLHFEMTKKHGVIPGSVFVGVIWSFWHAPLWFITSGYHGWKLVIFISTFLLCNLSASVIIGILYDHKKNLLIPVIIHYMFNLGDPFYLGDRLHFFGVTGVLYFLFAVVVVTWYRKKIRA